MPVLLFIRGPLTGTRVALDGSEVLVGRGTQCGVVVMDVAVSRLHAILRATPGGWAIEDHSKSGTYVNGRRVDRAALQPGDEVRLGKSAAIFEPAFDLQNADFTDNSVFLSASNDETVTIQMRGAIEVQAQSDDSVAPAREGLELIAEIGELFDSRNVPFGDALRSTTERISRILRTDAAIAMLYDGGSSTLRVSAAVAGRDVQADSATLMRVYRERRALLFSQPETHMTEDSATLPARSCMAAPLATPDECLGVLYCERDEAHAFSLKDLRLAVALARLMATFVEARRAADATARRLSYDFADGAPIGTSAPFREALKMVHRVAATPATALLVGETGSGKEVLARELHRLSPQGANGGPFVPVNCAAIPENLFESELFGHEKGAFTGAHRLHQGYIELANGGTLFLDEIGEMAPQIQPKLLRFLQEKTFMRVGGTRVLRAEVRIVAATNRDLLAETREGRFREDLYHRLAVFPIRVPPLRERREDIRNLAEHYCAVYAKRLGRRASRVSEEAMALLENYAWPGNVRELANCIERAVLLCDGKALVPENFAIGLGESLARHAAAPAAASDRTPTPTPRPALATLAKADGTPDLRPLDDVEKEHILRVLDHVGNPAKACEILGIHRNTLRNKMKEWGMGG